MTDTGDDENRFDTQEAEQTRCNRKVTFKIKQEVLNNYESKLRNDETFNHYLLFLMSGSLPQQGVT